MFTIFTSVCGASNEIGLISPLIIDGVAAHVGAFPWHAGLYYRKVDEGKEIWDQKCGGSLITDQFILTGNILLILSTNNPRLCVRQDQSIDISKVVRSMVNPGINLGFSKLLV